MVLKDEVLKGLRFELSRDEIRKIYQSDSYEKYDYYDFSVLIKGIEKTINNEIEFDDFIDWCILIANAFNYIPARYNEKELYYDIAETMDGASFFEEYNKKELLWLHAIIRYYNHLITKKKERKEVIFETDNIERILCFDHVNRTDDSSVYKALIKNHNTNEFRQLYVDNGFYDFDKKINYCFMDEEEYEDAFSSLFDDNWAENHNIIF